MPNILHLVEDHQVTDRSISIFKRLFSNNTVIIFSNNRTLKHIKENSDCTIITDSNYLPVINHLDFSQIDCVIVHYMSFAKIDFIRHIPANIHVSWSIYGGDLYNQFADILKHKIYYSKPDKYMKYGAFRFLFSGLFRWLLFLKNGDTHILRRHRKRDLDYIVNRISSVSGAKCDIELLESYSKRKYEVRPSLAYPLEVTLGDLYGGKYASGSEIVIGNSASFSNNHLYALKKLRKVSIPQEVSVRLTLSYGGSSNYKKKVIKEYRNVYGESLCILLDYVPLQEYNKMFLKTRIMILPAWRQESFGTILMGLYLGIKIYLSKKNPLYITLTEQEFILFCIEDIDEHFIDPLNPIDQQYNRMMVERKYNTKKIDSGICDFMNRITMR